MASQKQIDANRRNAAHSTGPRTSDGKAASCKNAVTHGLRALDCAILPGESQADYAALREALVRDLQPRGVLQRELVDDITLIRWKLRRVPKIEAEMVRREQVAHERDYKQPISAIGVLAHAFLWENKSYATLELYRLRLERSMHNALRQFRKLREETGEGEEMVQEEAGKMEEEPTPCDPHVESKKDIESIFSEPISRGVDAKAQAVLTRSSIRTNEPNLEGVGDRQSSSKKVSTHVPQRKTGNIKCFDVSR